MLIDQLLKVVCPLQVCGECIAEIIPSRAGNYSFRVFGTIGEQAINEGFTSTAGEFSSVEPVSDVSFPDAIPSTVELLEQIEAPEARIAALEAGE
jgi:hypothetical protein